MEYIRTNIGTLATALLLVPFLGLLVLAGDDADATKKLFDKNCLTCHGADCKAGTKVGAMLKTPDLTTEEWKMGTGQAEVEKIIREGIGKMPKYEKRLTDEQISQLAKYVKKLCAVDEE